jgi:hypothetical protein
MSVARGGCAAGALTQINNRDAGALSNVRLAGLIRAPTLNDPIAWSPPQPCPICGVAMLGRPTNASLLEFDRFECFNCGLVMNYSKKS